MQNVYSYLIVENFDAYIIVTINNADKLNVLNTALLKELSEVVSSINNRIVIITGAGKAFVAGADISEMINLSQDEAKQYSVFGASLFRKIETSNNIFIAAVNGYALGGGCELAMACDLRIASDKAMFGQPEINLSIIPGFSATQRLPRLIGITKAKELIYTGRIIDADEALQTGLVNKVVGQNGLMEQAIKLAEILAQKSIYALINAKQAINNIFEFDMEQGIKTENGLFSSCFETFNQRESMLAFLEKIKR